MISFCVPFRPDNDYREKAFEFLARKLSDDWAGPGVQLIMGDSRAEQFNRSASRNAAAKQATGDVLIFVDADSVVPKAQIEWALAALEHTHWAFPYNQYFALTEVGSQAFMDGNMQPEYKYLFPSTETPEPSVGGCVVVRRSAFDLVHGYDERFIGWGEEDRAFALALGTLCGPPAYSNGPLYHLWHPDPDSEHFDQPHFMDNRLLCNRYRSASGNPALMHQLVMEH